MKEKEIDFVALLEAFMTELKNQHDILDPLGNKHYWAQMLSIDALSYIAHLELVLMEMKKSGD